MRKYELKSNGIPLFVNREENLKALHQTSFDSWYVICNFEADGVQYGFEWHQQSVQEKFCTAEFFLMDAGRNIYSNNAVDLPIQMVTQSYDKLDVKSPIGGLEGDIHEMQLKVAVEDGSVDVIVRPKDTLYNGTCGMLKFLGGDFSYQYSFPNMEIEGTMTIKGKTVAIQNTTAWFDRQWGTNISASNRIKEGSGMNKLSWLWLGMTLEEGKGAVSLWDSYGPEGRNAFATILGSDGIQYNAEADITYEGVWTSKDTGYSYPRVTHFSVPKADLQLRLEFLAENPEVYREGVPIVVCQGLCRVEGSYKGKAINRHVILEIVGDLNGEI